MCKLFHAFQVWKQGPHIFKDVIREYLGKFKSQEFHGVNIFFQRCVPVASPKKEGLLQVPNVHHRVYRKVEDGELVIATLQNQINLNGVLNVFLVQVLL